MSRRAAVAQVLGILLRGSGLAFRLPLGVGMGRSKVSSII